MQPFGVTVILIAGIYRTWNLFSCYHRAPEMSLALGVPRTMGHVVTDLQSDIRLSVCTSQLRTIWVLFVSHLSCEDSSLLSCYNWSVVPTFRRNVTSLFSVSRSLSLFLGCLMLKIEALLSFETSVRTLTLPLVSVPATGCCS